MSAWDDAVIVTRKLCNDMHWINRLTFKLLCHLSGSWLNSNPHCHYLSCHDLVSSWVDLEIVGTFQIIGNKLISSRYMKFKDLQRYILGTCISDFRGRISSTQVYSISIFLKMNNMIKLFTFLWLIFIIQFKKFLLLICVVRIIICTL